MVLKPHSTLEVHRRGKCPRQCRVLKTLVFSGWVSWMLCGFPPASADSDRIRHVTGLDSSGAVERLSEQEGPGTGTAPAGRVKPGVEKAGKPAVHLSSREIYHHQILEVTVEGLLRLDPELLTMQVMRGGNALKSYGRLREIPFRREGDLLRAVYLPGWNEREGALEIGLFYDGTRLRTTGNLEATLKRRAVSPPDGFLSVVDLEMNSSIRTRSMVNPEGVRSDYTALLEWARYLRADLLWILAGETTSFSPRSRGESPWDPGPLENLRLLKERARDYGIGVGAYIMAYYVPGKNGVPERYEPGLGYNREHDYLYRARHISLASEQRILDMIELAARFQRDPNVQYIGFDFIRTGAADGYELAEEVIHDTGIAVPGSWERLAPWERTRWFARKIELDKDPDILEKWRWWRAHRVASIVQRVIEEAEITKPVWVYTLGWDHGREHGQDPVMFFDAGVSVDAVMLYESTREQFVRLLGQWNRYLRAGQGNVIVGNCVDRNLLDSERFSPPEEFYRRNVEGFGTVMGGGTASGVFFHDLSRLLWGRRGEHSPMDYAVAHLSSLYKMKNTGESPDLIVEVVDGTVLALKNNSTDDFTSLEIKTLHPEQVRLGNPGQNGSSLRIERLGTFESIAIPFTVHHGGQPGMVGFSIARDGVREYFFSEILQVPPREGASPQADVPPRADARPHVKAPSRLARR